MDRKNEIDKEMRKFNNNLDIYNRNVMRRLEMEESKMKILNKSLQKDKKIKQNLLQFQEEQKIRAIADNEKREKMKQKLEEIWRTEEFQREQTVAKQLSEAEQRKSKIENLIQYRNNQSKEKEKSQLLKRQDVLLSKDEQELQHEAIVQL